MRKHTITTAFAALGCLAAFADTAIPLEETGIQRMRTGWGTVRERMSVEGGELRACRVVFGAEPSGEEVQELVCKHWNKLRFTEPIGVDAPPKAAANPKRRHREAARALSQRGPSTKAQQALSEEREAAARQRKVDSRERRKQEEQRRFEQRQEKRKQKHRGK